MPYKKRMNARFPPARIKKIMQKDEEVGKVSSSVPVMVSRALERFLEYFMTASAEITTSKDAKTLTSQHILEVITNDHRLQFLKEAALKSCSMANGNGSYGASGLTEVSSGNSKKNLADMHADDSDESDD